MNATTVATDTAPITLDERIRAAYRFLADAPGAYVHIGDVRRLVGTYQATPEQLDAALCEMFLRRDVRICPATFVRLRPTTDDRENAVTIRGFACHMLRVG